MGEAVPPPEPFDNGLTLDVHAAQRTVGNIAVLAALSLLLLAGLSSSAVSARLGVTVVDGAIVVAAFMPTTVVAYLVFHRWGRSSRAYALCDYLESFVLSACIIYLIYASKSAVSFFWILYLVHVLLTSLAGLRLAYAATVSVGPACLALLFAWRNDATSAWISAAATLLGTFVYLTFATFYHQYVSALRREAALRAELAQMILARERTRISRDLHDGVASELTALVWNVREMSVAMPPAERAQAAAVAERLRDVIDDLRRVVLSLREPPRSFAELESLLESRTRELCSGAALELRIEGVLDPGELSAFQESVLPVCLELVRNAATHAGARHVFLTLNVHPRELEIEVRDDGMGLSHDKWQHSGGGLRSARHRVERLGGVIDLTASASGTWFTITLPRPLATNGSDTA